MKKLLVFVAATVACICISTASHAQLDKLKQKIKDKISQKSDNNTTTPVDTTRNNDNNTNTGTDNPAPTTASFKTYQNYDFVPGDKILFEDNFAGDQDGEFPSHWELTKGQAIINKIGDQPAFLITEGNYGTVRPRMKTDKYLTEPFTIEYDYYNKDNAYGLMTFLSRIDPACDCETTASIQTSTSEAGFEGGVSLSKTYPASLSEGFTNKWHHIAIAVKNHQLKVYVDQNRVLVVPDTKSDFYNVSFGGIGSDEQPLIFKNVRIASGGDMNMIGKKFTESKIVTHGINFDVDKATIKPESMGTLNMIVQVMKDNPDVKFEIDGHTDNTGTAAHNLTLSQQRAEAVKTQLINMGVSASRLTSKGFGDGKPISDNNTFEGKANNRRVEFVKM